MNEYSRNIKQCVKRFRAEGKTYSEIIKKLNIKIPKSTLSHWCHNVPLPAWYMDKINKLNYKNLTLAQKMACLANRIKREKYLKNLKEKNKNLLYKIQDKDILKMLLAFLYLGEGSKWKYRRGLSFGNSDPDVIKLYLHLLSKCYEIIPKTLKCRIGFRADQNLRSLQRYWSKVTSIPLKNFYRSIPDPRTIGKSTKKKEYRGVCVVHGGGTHIQLELEMIPKILLEGL